MITDPLTAHEFPWDAPATIPERAIGPRVRSEVAITPETNIEPYDYGTGCHLWIGVPFESYVLVGLGWDDDSRRDACDRLIAALTEARDWKPAEASA